MAGNGRRQRLSENTVNAYIKEERVCTAGTGCIDAFVDDSRTPVMKLAL